MGLARGVLSYPVYVHIVSTLDSPAIRPVIHRFAGITGAPCLGAARSEAALAQGALEEARRIELVGEIPLEWPRLAFHLRGDEFGA